MKCADLGNHAGKILRALWGWCWSGA
jgi:hypothetical protein